MNFKNETFTKQYHCINKIKLPNVKVDLTHVTLINIILSYQLNGKDCYIPHKELMDILMVGKTKLYKILDELIKTKLLNSNTKRLGPNKGSLTNLSINLDKLEEYLTTNTNIPETKESPLEELKPIKEEDMNIPSNDEMDNQIENELKSKETLTKSLIKKIAPDLTEDDFRYYDVEDVAKALINANKYNDKYLMNSLNELYRETENKDELIQLIEE